MDGDAKPLVAGTRIAIDPAMPCGHCEGCRDGHPNLCANLSFLGAVPHPGAMQEHLIVPGHCCFPLPDDFDAGVAVMLEPLGVAIHACDLAKPTLGDDAFVLGGGTIGLLVLQVLRASGVRRVFLSDPVPERRAIAERYGAIACTPDEALATIDEQTAGRGVDVSVECAWADADALDQAAGALRLGGRMVVVGIPVGDDYAFPASQVRRKGVTVRFSRRMQHTYPQAIDLVARGIVDVSALVTHRRPMEQAGEAFEIAGSYADGAVKVLVEIGEDLMQKFGCLLFVLIAGVVCFEVWIAILVAEFIGEGKITGGLLATIIAILVLSFIGYRLLRWRLKSLKEAVMGDATGAFTSAFGAILLIIPGFVTGVFGLLLQIPPIKLLGHQRRQTPRLHDAQGHGTDGQASGCRRTGSVRWRGRPQLTLRWWRPEPFGGGQNPRQRRQEPAAGPEVARRQTYDVERPTTSRRISVTATGLTWRLFSRLLGRRRFATAEQGSRQELATTYISDREGPRRD